MGTYPVSNAVNSPVKESPAGLSALIFHSRAKGMAVRKASAARRKAPSKRSDAVEAPEAAPRAALPDFIRPELATLVDKAPDGSWLHEIKFDGYRTAGHIRSGRVRMLTRKGLDWTVRFHPIADALAGLKALNAYVDGEIAVVGEDGVTSFAELQAVLSDGPANRLVYCAFDLLHLDRRDLMPLPLVQRKEALQTLLAGLQEIGRIVDQAVGQPVGEHVPSQSSPVVGTGRRAANAHCVAWR
jgi:bifunctional non-homologous end joining protein LigD